jgi:hypothetical protein
MPGDPGKAEAQLNGRFRDELLSGEVFFTLKEAQVC